MEEEQYQANNKRNPVFWILIIIVIIIVAGGAYYFLVADNEGDTNNANNANASVNATANANVAVNENVNATTNINMVTNTNATVDTSGWETYTNDEYGYSIKYPPGWTHTYVYEDDDPNVSYEEPLHYSIVTSADNQVRLMLGIEREGDVGTTYYRTGIGAGDIKAGDKLTVASIANDTWQRVFEGRVVEIFLFPVINGVSSIALDDHEITASFAIIESDTYRVDITKTNEYKTILEILESLSLSE